MDITTPLWAQDSLLWAYYDDTTGWHLEEIEERGHFVVDTDGHLWSIPKSICAKSYAPGDLVYEDAIPSDWTVKHLEFVRMPVPGEDDFPF